MNNQYTIFEDDRNDGDVPLLRSFLRYLVNKGGTFRDLHLLILWMPHSRSTYSFCVDALNRQQYQKAGFALAGSGKESIITIVDRMSKIESEREIEVFS